MIARLSAGEKKNKGVEPQQHAPGVEALGDDSEPPPSELAVIRVVAEAE